MAQRKVLRAGVVGAVIVTLAVVAYIVAAQFQFAPNLTLGPIGEASSYQPTGWEITIAPGQTGEIPFPHGVPFHVTVGLVKASEVSGPRAVVGQNPSAPIPVGQGSGQSSGPAPANPSSSRPKQSDAGTGFLAATEANCVVSWVGLNGDGTVTQGVESTGTAGAILTVGDVVLGLNPSCGHSSSDTELDQPGHTLLIDAQASIVPVHVTVIR